MHPCEMHWARSLSLISYYYYSSICLGIPLLAGEAQSCSFSYSFLRPRVSISIDNPAIDLCTDGWLYIKCQAGRLNRFSRALETRRLVFQALGLTLPCPLRWGCAVGTHFALSLWMPSISSPLLSEPRIPRTMHGTAGLLPPPPSLTMNLLVAKEIKPQKHSVG